MDTQRKANPLMSDEKETKRLAQDFEILFSPEVVEKRIDAILEPYLSFLEYAGEYNVEEELYVEDVVACAEEYIDEEILPLANKGFCLEAFNIGMELHDTVSREICHFSASSRDLEKACDRLLRSILGISDPDTKAKLFAIAINRDDVFIEQIVFECFEEDCYDEAKHAVIEQALQRANDEEETTRNYHLDLWTKRKDALASKQADL